MGVWGRWGCMWRSRVVGSGFLGVRASIRCFKGRMAGVNAGIAVRYPLDPPAGWSPMDAGEAWHVEDY